MAINYNNLRSLTARKLLNALEKDSFKLRKGKGATRLYRHDDGRRVTIHLHRPGQTLKIGTLKEIIENQAQWSENDLKRLGLLK